MEGAAHFEKQVTRFDLIESNERFLGRLHLHHGGKPMVEQVEVPPKIVLIPTKAALEFPFKGPPKARAIIYATAEFYEMPWRELVSACRSAPLVRARFSAIWLMRNLTPWSLPKIGRYFGNRDHTSILHAIRRVDEMLKTDERLAGEIDIIKLKIWERYRDAAISNSVAPGEAVAGLQEEPGAVLPPAG